MVQDRRLTEAKAATISFKSFLKLEKSSEESNGNTLNSYCSCVFNSCKHSKRGGSVFHDTRKQNMEGLEGQSAILLV